MAAILAAAALSLAAPHGFGELPGLHGLAAAAECEGDECQSPPPPPEDPVPGTAVAQGPPNPPVRFPARRAKRPRNKGDRHGDKRGRRHRPHRSRR